jgi:hypothetical protein
MEWRTSNTLLSGYIQICRHHSTFWKRNPTFSCVATASDLILPTFPTVSLWMLLTNSISTILQLELSVQRMAKSGCFHCFSETIYARFSHTSKHFFHLPKSTICTSSFAGRQRHRWWFAHCVVLSDGTSHSTMVLVVMVEDTTLCS